MNLAESQKIEGLRLNFTNDFLMEIAKCINDIMSPRSANFGNR